MKRKKFSDQDKVELLKCHAISKVSDTKVSYSSSFKLQAVEEYFNGKTPLKIFIDAGINVNILGRENPEKSIKRWRNKAKNFGKESLLENWTGRTRGYGRPRSRFNSAEDEIKFLKARVEYLKEENDFLKKLEALEREVM